MDSTTKTDLKDKYLFITGPFKGIGHRIALAHAKAGAAAIGVRARSRFSGLEEDLGDVAKEAGETEPKMLTVKSDVENGP